MATNADSYHFLCMLMTLLTRRKVMGYEVKDIFTNQADNLEIVISTPNGFIERGIVEVTVVRDNPPIN